MKGGFPMTRNPYEVGVVILSWGIANSLGIAAIGALSLIPLFLKPIHGMPVSSLIHGLPIGFAQWIAFRRVAPISILWVLTISTGLFLGLVAINNPIFAGIWGFFFEDESALSMTAACMIIGLIIGLAQWLFLRGHFTKSWVWPFSSAVGIGLGIGLVLISNLINQSGIVSIILVVLVYTITTGLVISWLSTWHRKTGHNLVNTT